jgi:capsular exopolysaccharide synthesis family protein
VEQKRASRITVESRARVPEKPNLDKRLKYSAVALGMGFMLGAGVALLRSRLDTRFRDPEGVTRRLGVRVLGSVQYLANNHAPQNAFDDRLAEPIRGISTALLAGSAARGARTRLITSPTPGSGKSSLAMHLARGLAATGRRVLLVDADNHGQGITRRLQMTDQPGLTDLLAGRLGADETVYTGDMACLSVIPAGPRDERFGDILSGRDAQARLRSLFAGFDEVIVDSPPVLAKSDTVVLATLVDEVVLVLRAGRSTQEEARAARQYLAAVGGNVVGVILNAVDPKHVRYGYSYSYSYAGSA